MRSRVEKTQFYDSRGLPSSISAAAIMNMAYTFNNKGNLISRSDLLTGHKEDFTYDGMNRLTAWNISKDNISQASNSIDYNPTTGTITTKSDVGFTFGYGEENGKPHALTSLSGKPDRIPNSTQTVTYTDFKKVKNISLGSKSLVLDYGVDEQRRKGVFKDGNATFTRYYSGNYEEEVDSSGKVKKIHYVSGGDGLVGIYINDDGNNRFYSTYCDYQGSLLALTDMNGVVKERYAYDPWGNRRNPASWKDTETRTKFIVDRGYTLHEHLDGFGLINMNGRVYDPLLGMFLSPDPYVQAPGNWLNYNRYGYCYGNPLSYTDPDGEIAWFIPVIIGAVIGAYTGASVQSGTAAFWDWKPDAWKGAISGAIIGATFGYGINGVIGATGMTTVAANGANVATKSAGLVSTMLNSGTINISMSVFSNSGWDGAWKAGVVGLAVGGWNASGGLGMVKGFNTTSNMGKLAGKLGYQMISTAGSSIGNNWVRNKGPFSNVTIGVGPVNLSIGKKQRLLQWQNNLGNIVMNTFGLSNLAFGGKMNFDWNNLSLNYTGGVVDHFFDPKIWYSGFGAHSVIGNSKLFNNPILYPHELHHLWQSRAFGDVFLLNYILQGVDAWAMGGSFIEDCNYFEDQANGGFWW